MHSLRQTLRPAVILTLVWLTLCFLQTHGVLAQTTTESFSASATSTYLVQPDAQVRVTHDFTLTNTTPTLYVTQYGLRFDTDRLTNFSATHNQAALEPHVVQSSGQTSVALTFADPVIGEGQQQHFTVTYTDPALANQVGKVIEVNIPATLDDSHFKTHTVHVLYPASLGPPSRLEPPPDSQTTRGNQIELAYTPAPERAIILVFGDHQTFDVTLTYPLSNTAVRSSTQVIALPPDTQNQSVNYLELSPQPNTIQRDDDGNWLAFYTVPPDSAFDVHAQLQLTTSLENDQRVPAPQAGEYLTQPRRFWESDSQLLQTTAASLTGIDAISEYVTDTLTYSEQTIDRTRERLGAEGALLHPTDAVCQEYTDLTVALARAKGMPAAAAIGYAYTTDEKIRPVGIAGDILHTWPEVYDTATQTWRRLDPTWEDTSGGLDYTHTFDLNHLVFARFGASSDQPNPAGSYNPDEPVRQLVNVSVATAQQPVTKSAQVSVSPVKLGPVTLPFLQRIALINPTGTALYDLKITLQTPEAESLLLPTTTRLPSYLLPFNRVEKIVPLFSTNSLPKNTLLTVTIDADELNASSTTTSQAIVLPQAWQEINTEQAILGLAVCCATGAFIAGGVLVWRRRRQRPLRGQSQITQEPPI